MRYETMGKARRQRLNIPQLLGGVNTATEAEFIEDDELADACNLRIDHGALRTREAVRTIGEEPMPIESQSGTYTHMDALVTKPIEVDGTMCALTALGMNDVWSEGQGSLKIVSLDGEVLQIYTHSTIRNNNRIDPEIAIAPYYDEKAPDCAFLEYYKGRVYVPDPSTGTMNQAGKEKLYAPLVMINGRSVAFDASSGSTPANGVMYEGFNLLAKGYYRVTHTPSVDNETSTSEHYLSPTDFSNEYTKDGSSVTVEIVSFNQEAKVTLAKENTSAEFTLGEETYTAVLYQNGTVNIKPPLPVSDVANTVTVTYKGSLEGSLPYVSLATWFGGTANKRGGTRLFLADADNSKLLWSDVNNPFYFPENNYMIVGDSSQTITALEKQSDMLVIFKEREIYYTTYVQGEIDTDAVANGTNVDVTAVQAYFPLTQLSPQIGCRCPHSIALCRDRLVWMDEDARIYTLVVSGQYSERNVREIGQKIRPWLLKKTTVEQRRNASAIDHNGKYRLMVGNVMAEFDYNDSGFVNVSSYYSGERAARNIAWMTHRYDFDGNAVQTLVSDGADKAIIISTAAKDDRVTRTLYCFDGDEDKDRYLTMDDSGAFQSREKDIAVSLTTKTYEFGDPAAYKRIHALYPMLQTDDAEITAIVDGAEPPYGRRYKSADTFAHLVLPGIRRCRTFALKLKAIGKLCLKGLRIEYSIFGNVK